jgi:NAD dependent epimerase/dehydratase family enzyme
LSWIAVDDAANVIRHGLSNESLSGPVNTVAPQAVTNREFTETLGRVLGRPTFLTVPSFVLRLAVGEMAEALLLASQRVLPARLQSSGYTFCYPELDGALRHVLGKPS